MKNERLIKMIIVGTILFAVYWFGIKPLITGESFKNYIKIDQDDLKFEENEYGAIVVGSEPEGVATALSCARTGLKTLLITSDSDLGSYIEKSKVAQMNPQEGLINRKKVLLNQGIYTEIFGKFSVGFSAEEYIKTVKKLVEEEESLRVIYDAYILEVDAEGEILNGILIQQPDGKHYYKARQFVDATADGSLLLLCSTPHFKGSADIGVPNFYMPLEFNFSISGVDVEALRKGTKTSDFQQDFEKALLAYKKVYPQTKIEAPTFIGLDQNELVITGLKIFGIDIEDETAMEEAFMKAEEEARMLTAFLKVTLAPFKNCTYKESPREFFIPEYRHFEGRYRLTVSDILENRNFRDKVALAAGAVDAGKFVDKNIAYIVAKPNVYSIPLGSLVPVNLKNVVMTGAKASFSSLASTSTGSLPTRITVGESVGLVAAYCVINGITPADILKFTDKELHSLKGYLTRGGLALPDFSEDLPLAESNQKLKDHWAYPYIKTLAEFGLIAGGQENDFKLDFRASEEVMAVLMKNAVLKMSPDDFSLELDQRLSAHEEKRELTGEMACEVLLDALNIPFEKGGALEAIKQADVLPDIIIGKVNKNSPVTMDIIYGMAVETAEYLKEKQ